MTFSTFTRDGSECGPSNGLNHLAKHISQEKQDHFYGKPQGENSKSTNGFRTLDYHRIPRKADNQLSNEFFHQNEHFEKSSFHQPVPVHIINEDWVRDFTSSTRVSHPPPSSFEDFEHIYQRNGSPLLRSNWRDEFYQQTPSSEVSEEEHLAFERAFEVLDEDKQDHRDWDKEFRDHESQQQRVSALCLHPSHSVSASTSHAQDWSKEFNKYYGLNTQEPERVLTHSLEHQVEWIQQYKHTIEKKTKEVQKEWDRLQPDGKPYGYRAIHKEHEIYNYMEDNPYLECQGAIEDAINNTLADAIMALEAKTQLHPDDAKAWEMLGLKQQENERDSIAIIALEKAVSLDPSCLDAWLALSVSYTNEHCRMDAYNCLEQWIAHNPKYKHSLQKKLGQNYSDEKKRHDYITHLFLQAAQSLPGGEEMDADVQVGLGVLFNMSEEYGKAVDCFKAALITCPYDYQLWNKVGATLANSRDIMGAIEMYISALEINPLFVRARYNLAISCMNMGRHQEAAEHLLTSLSLQQAAFLSAGESASVTQTSIPNNGTSNGIWDSLRLLMYMMSREDLASQCDHHNLDAFRPYFDF